MLQEVTFQAGKMKKPTLKMFLVFREKELSCHKLKKPFIFKEGIYKAPKTNKKPAPKKFLLSWDVFVIFTAV